MRSSAIPDTRQARPVMGHHLDSIALYRLRVPLTAPYHLAFGVVNAYETILVEIADVDGRCGIGEGTVLTGYSDETIEDSWAAADAFAKTLHREKPRQAAQAILGFGARFPTAATAFGTALEMLQGAELLVNKSDLAIPLVGLLGTKTEQELQAEFATQFASGYRTFKVKVGFDVKEDVARVRAVQRIVRGKGVIRLDANQGYSADQGVAFLKSLDPADIELFEQPCASGDWASHLAVAKHSPVPVMLDESIHGVADVEKAAALGAASYIKLKLTKLVSLQELERAISRIKSLGMTPVLGNGVACDVGCWMEACVAARHITNAGEMNGYLKTGTHFLIPRLEFADGSLLVKAGFSPALDRDAVAQHTVAARTYGTAAL